MALPGAVLHGVPIEIAVVAAVGNEGVIRLHAPLQVVLQQSLPLADGRTHFGAVHHLRLPPAVPLHHLRQVKMIAKLLIRHRGLEQGVPVNVRASHGFRPFLSAVFYRLYRFK